MGHEAGQLPARRRIVEIYDLGGVSSPTSSHIKNLPHVIHDRCTIVAGSIGPIRYLGPLTSSRQIEIAGRHLLACIKDPAIRGQERAGVVGQYQAGCAQYPYAAA